MRLDRTPPVICPYCGKSNELHASTSDLPPEPGHWSVCVVCGQVAMFDASPFGVVARRLTDDEVREAADSEVVQEALRLLPEIRRQIAQIRWTR